MPQKRVQHARVGGGVGPWCLAFLLMFGVPRQHIGLYTHTGVAVVRKAARKAENLMVSQPAREGFQPAL